MHNPRKEKDAILKMNFNCFLMGWGYYRGSGSAKNSVAGEMYLRNFRSQNTSIELNGKSKIGFIHKMNWPPSRLLRFPGTVEAGEENIWQRAGKSLQQFYV
jgi:hypothetical protein